MIENMLKSFEFIFDGMFTCDGTSSPPHYPLFTLFYFVINLIFYFEYFLNFPAPLSFFLITKDKEIILKFWEKKIKDYFVQKPPSSLPFFFSLRHLKTHIEIFL